MLDRTPTTRPAALVALWRKSRRNFRSIATQLEHQWIAFALLAQDSSPQVRALGIYAQRETPKVVKEARAIADILDAWLRTDRMPSRDEFDSYARRVREVVAMWMPLAEQLVATLKPEDAP
jgi:hypothetical protein